MRLILINPSREPGNRKEGAKMMEGARMTPEVRIDYETLLGRLAQELKKRGVKRKEICAYLSMAPATISQKMRGTRHFFFYEMLGVC